MNDQNKNQTPAPTVPNQNIFESKNLSGQAGGMNPPQVGGMNPPVVNKKEVISSVTGRKRNPLKNVLIVVGGIVVVLLVVVLIKSLVSNINSSKKAEIVWWSVDEDGEAVSPLIDEYQKQNPNVTVKFVKQDLQDYRERLANALSQGRGPDIFEFHNSWVPMFANTLVESKNDYSSSFYPVVTSDLKTRTGFLGIPLEYDGIALFVNQDIMRAYGKVAPKTWNELRDLANSLTVRNQDGTIRQSGVAIGITSNIDYWQDIFALLALQNGTDLKNVASSFGQSTLTFYTNFSKIDRVWDDTLPTSSAYFGQGLLAMYFGKYSDAISFSKNPNLHFQVVPLPQLSSGSNISYASYWVNGVSKASKRQTEAWRLLEFMTSKTSLAELYKNEVKVRGYGNLYPRVDMQSELLSDSLAAPFIYQAGFARSWYLDDKTYDGATGINTLVAKPFEVAIDALNGNSTADNVSVTLQTSLTSVLAGFGLVAAPKATP